MNDLFRKLYRAYMNSTKNDNKFKKTIESIKWDYTFFADDEYYFCIGDERLSTASLDPFDMPYEPVFTHGVEMMYFDDKYLRIA